MPPHDKSGCHKDLSINLLRWLMWVIFTGQMPFLSANRQCQSAEQKPDSFASLTWHSLKGRYPRQPGYQNVAILYFTGVKDDGGGEWWQLELSDMQSSSQIIAINKPTPSFLQAGCPSCHPTNSARALKGNLPVSYNFSNVLCTHHTETRRYWRCTAEESVERWQRCSVSWTLRTPRDSPPAACPEPHTQNPQG